MADPSTPLSLSTNTAGPSSVTPGSQRHLKRLSLSTASAFSPSSPSSPLSLSARDSSATPQTPAERRAGAQGHGVRGLRLSLSGSLPPSFAASPSGSGPPTPAEDAQPMTRQGSTSPTLLRKSTSLRRPPPSSSPAPGSPDLDAGSSSAPRASRSSHSRRTSSMSYAPRTSLDAVSSGMNGLGLGGVEQRNSLDGGSETGRLTVDDLRSSTSMSRGPSGSSAGLREVREEPEEGAAEGGTEALASSTRTVGASASQPTFVEQNADLLSFIAKKERKCLDLREELKRHEAELALLKKKLSNIIEKQHAPAPFSSHPRNASISTVSSASPNTSPTPRSSATLYPVAHTAHSLDLSLLSSTFDPTGDFDTLSAASGGGMDTPPIEIPESVRAAGNWLGGALGRVLDAAVGLPSPVDERPNGLESLKEEDEEEDCDEEARNRRRESKGSSVETEGSSSVAGSRSTAPSSVASEETVSPPQPSGPFETPARSSSLRNKPAAPHSASPTTSRSSLFTPPSSAPSSSSHHHPANPLSQSLPPSSSHASHSRSRSTALDALSGGWSSFNRRLAAFSESEAVQASKRATLGLVEGLERGLESALGPLEPPPLEEAPQSPTRRTQEGRRGSKDDGLGQGQGHPAPKEIPSPFLAAAPPTAAARDAMAFVPGQGLSSVFSSWSAATSSKPSVSIPPTQHQQPQQQQQQQASGFDWSAFLPSSSTDNSPASSPVKEKAFVQGKRRSAEIVKQLEEEKQREAERAKAGAPEDEGDEWPAW
ncbi:hypothetical protein JCM8547_002817 [Rhodosporidiobolus lusitaniae]